MLELYVHLHVFALALASRAGETLAAARRPARRSARPPAPTAAARRFRPRRAQLQDAGQTTAEYALVLLAAAAIALLVIAWATKTNRIGKLFDFVLDQIIGKVT